MAINLVSIKCPDCGAALDVEEGRKQLFCSYCGAKVLVDNENEHIIRHVDEAEIKKAESNQVIQLKRAEVDKTVQLKKLEIDDRSRIEKERVKIIKIITFLVLIIIAVFLFMSGSSMGILAGMLLIGLSSQMIDNNIF